MAFMGFMAFFIIRSASIRTFIGRKSVCSKFLRITRIGYTGFDGAFDLVSLDGASLKIF